MKVSFICPYRREDRENGAIICSIPIHYWLLVACLLLFQKFDDIYRGLWRLGGLHMLLSNLYVGRIDLDANTAPP